jgi:hypothetical protein
VLIRLRHIRLELRRSSFKASTVLLELSVAVVSGMSGSKHCCSVLLGNLSFASNCRLGFWPPSHTASALHTCIPTNQPKHLPSTTTTACKYSTDWFMPCCFHPCTPSTPSLPKTPTTTQPEALCVLPGVHQLQHAPGRVGVQGALRGTPLCQLTWHTVQVGSRACCCTNFSDLCCQLTWHTVQVGSRACCCTNFTDLCCQLLWHTVQVGSLYAEYAVILAGRQLMRLSAPHKLGTSSALGYTITCAHVQYSA